MADTFTCHDCGKVKPVQHEGGTGYGYYPDNPDAKICYDCCAIRDRQSMIDTGKATLYFTHGGQDALGRAPGYYEITNWPGTLRFPAVSVRKFRHPFAREAWLGTFPGPDGKLWRFKNVGSSQIAHCRRAAS